MAGETEGAITRQLLPWNISGQDAKMGAARMYRYVTWEVQPVAFEDAWAHAAVMGDAGCMIITTRGPQGGWNDTRFIIVDNHTLVRHVTRMIHYRNAKRGENESVTLHRAWFTSAEDIDAYRRKQQKSIPKWARDP